MTNTLLAITKEGTLTKDRNLNEYPRSAPRILLILPAEQSDHIGLRVGRRETPGKGYASWKGKHRVGRLETKFYAGIKFKLQMDGREE